VMESDYVGARLLGIHQEGPFFTYVRRGIFPPANLREPSVELAKKWTEAARGALRYTCMAPELPNALEVLDYYVENGIVVGLAHSDATYAQAVEAIDRGMSVTIHVGNALRPIHQREVSVWGASLLDDRISCEMICDYHHLSEEMIRMTIKMKGYEKIHMISDCGGFAGMPAGKYDMNGRIMYLEKSGLVRSEDGIVGGSSMYMLFGVQNLIETIGVPVKEVLRMSSLNPARILGLEHRKGSIAERKDADFVVITDDYKAVATYVEGVLTFNGESAASLGNPDFTKAMLEAF